jgi:transcriptional regulator with AAA-type ATPase domain
MSLLSDSERDVLEAFARLANGNPFLPERVGAEEAALGDAFVRSGAVWHVEADLDGLNPNVARLAERAEAMAEGLHGRLARGERATERELALYQTFVFYLLYQRYEGAWRELIGKGLEGAAATRPGAEWKRFVRDVERHLALPDRAFPEPTDPAFLFALGFQIRRAFHYTFRQIYGASLPAAELRAAVWQSIFTHDGPRYRRDLTLRMADVPTLVHGESGTGKELVARAIAFSRFVPFDAERAVFAADFAKLFRGLSLSALSPTLVESELFGHRRGAFTGALEDREGWLEGAGPFGTVFLDEIGELDPAIQVKLLRVLQTRSFERIGESSSRRFEGKIAAATNRDLALEMRAGRFRDDLYYRLCADLIRTPTLREQLADSRDELRNLALVLARRLVGPDEAARLTDEVVRFVARELGPGYRWPGNVRELEQCVRSVLVRGAYRPPQVATADPDAELATALAEGRLTADELLRRYVAAVYELTGSYEETGRRLGLDRRTVKAKLSPSPPPAVRRSPS